mmetsp:Transcript_1461/g.2378  ORF Transcript_1461/g.2378 Transcript_1461/m.2378 type:complete len:116 (+) Transcript_1461:533-880(+)
MQKKRQRLFSMLEGGLDGVPLPVLLQHSHHHVLSLVDHPLASQKSLRLSNGSQNLGLPTIKFSVSMQWVKCFTYCGHCIGVMPKRRIGKEGRPQKKYHKTHRTHLQFGEHGGYRY